MRVLLITLGGSDYPAAPDLRHESFAASNREVVDLLTDPEAPLIQPEDNFDLFNDNRAWSVQLVAIRDWLRSRGERSELSPTDVIIHYVGHGSFRSNSLDYYLTINSTDNDLRADTSIGLVGLHDVLKPYAQKLRVVIIIDACFAAAAWRDLQSEERPDAKVRAQVGHIIEEAAQPASTQANGIAALCSSEKYETSNARGEKGVTQFTEAFSAVLRTGASTGPERLPLGTVLELMLEVLSSRYEEPVKPVLLAPRTARGSIERHPLFPNRARKHVAPYLTNIKPEQREALKDKVSQFVAELAECPDQLTLDSKLGQLVNMGGKEIAEGVGRRDDQQPGYRPAEPPDVSKALNRLDEMLAEVRPDGSSGLSLRRIGYLLNPAKAFDHYVATVSTEWIPALLGGVAGVKDEFLINNAVVDVDRAKSYKTRGKLEQMYLIAHELELQLRALEERVRSARPELAASLAVRALPTVSERGQALTDAIKAQELKDTQLQGRKAGNVMMVRALDRLQTVVASGLASSVEAASLLAQLAREKKSNPQLAASFFEAFDHIQAEMKEVQALHDRTRGAQAGDALRVA